MVMFQAAVGKFVKTVGNETLLPVPDIYSADHCRPLNVVIKKSRRWFWQSCKYEPREFTIEEFLKTPKGGALQLERKTKDLVTYDRTHTFSASGRTGEKLKGLLGAELSGSDSVELKSNLGLIRKIEIDRAKLMKELSTRCVDLDHPQIAQVRANARKVVCVVVGVAITAQDGNLNANTNAKRHGQTPIVETSHEGAEGKELVIPKGTPLAYRVCELWICTRTGRMTPMFETDMRGGFGVRDDCDAILREPRLDDIFKAIFSLPANTRKGYTSALLNLCSRPRIIEEIFLMVKRAWHFLVDTNVQYMPYRKTASDLQHESGSHFVDVQTILKLCGFQYESQGTILPPDKGTAHALLDAVYFHLEAVMELDDEEIMALANCDETVAPEMISLLLNMTEGRTVSADTVPHLRADTAHALLLAIGIQVNDSGEYVSRDNNPCELHGAYRAVVGLWGK